MLENIKEVIDLIVTAEVVFYSTASWEIKYDTIFGMGIWRQIRELGYSFDWCDPDTSYEEDVRAYMEALIDFRKSFGNLLET